MGEKPNLVIQDPYSWVTKMRYIFFAIGVVTLLLFVGGIIPSSVAITIALALGIIIIITFIITSIIYKTKN